MINADMRWYDYFTIGEKDAYGQATMPAQDAVPTGQIKMAINLSSQTVQDNINYLDAQYIGLTHAPINESYIIQYGKDRLKVLYVNPKGRLTQVFMAAI